MPRSSGDKQQDEIAALRQQLQEAQETLEAIRSGQVDALLVAGESGEQVFTLKGADHGYRLFVESMHEGAVTLRVDGLILHCNARFASLLETPLVEIIGQSLQKFVPKKNRGEVSEFLASTDNLRQEFQLVSLGGREIPVLLALSEGFVDEATGAKCLIVTDIREQKYIAQLQQTKSALEESQNQLSLALETARLGSWEFHVETGVIDCSSQCLANLGQAPGFELTHQSLFDLIVPDDRERVGREIQRSLQSDDFYECEYRIRWPDGSIHWTRASGRVIRRENGVATGMVGVSLDTTIRKEAEERLKESEHRFRTLAEAIPQLSWTCLPDGRCDYLSQQWIDYTGIPLEKQLGLQWLSVLHPEDQERTAQAWDTAVRTNGEYDLEFRIQGANGDYRWFKTRGTPVKDASGQVVRWFGTCTEIEAIVQARQILDRDKSQLEELVRTRTASLNETTEHLNNFCYSIAHDLRAPLRTQQGYARIILEDYGAQIGENGKQYAERIVAAAEKLEKLVQDLLSHVSISRGDLPLAKVEIASVIAHVRADLSDVIHESGGRVQLGSLQGNVLGNESSLTLIVSNLVSNALKYTKPGQTPLVKIWTEPSGANIRLWVEDRGIGIKPEYHKKIFGVFQRLHTAAVYQGTGIGLALVKKGIERMGGTTGVLSEPGVGSKFWIELRADDDSFSA